MYVRRKSNISGSTSVVVVQKHEGKCRYLKTLGVSSDPKELDDLYLQGKQWISEQKGERDMFLEHTKKIDKKSVVEGLLNKIELFYSTEHS